MSFAAVWKRVQESDPKDRMDTMDTIPFQSNSVHSVQCVHRGVKPKTVSTPDGTSSHGGDWYDEEICTVIEELNTVGVVVPAVSELMRRKALRLEREITEAVLSDDGERFRKALAEWRETWMRSLH